MNIRLNQLIVSTRRTTEKILFSESVTFLYGPVGTGKSTVARLIDYCFGGDLERTPAIQQEFVSVILNAKLGDYDCTFERSTKDKQSVRVTWALGENDYGSVNAPLIASQAPLLNAEVYTLSDLMFHLCGVEPIKVHKRSQDQNSQMIRLGFRDIWLFCYLDQAHLDSSFFRMEDPFRGRKSQDAMRFFTGLHSERLSKLQEELCRTETEQQGAREAVSQIRHFMKQFNFESQNEIITQIEESKRKLLSANNQIQTIEKTREIILHPTEELRNKLRNLSQTIFDLREAVSESQIMISEQEALRAELIATKVKINRTEQAVRILSGVDYSVCPQCGSDISERTIYTQECHLCRTPSQTQTPHPNLHTEAVRLELNDRIDQISDSINRRKNALERSVRELRKTECTKKELDFQLQKDLKRYDSAFIESIRLVEREVATYEERLRSLIKLKDMFQSVDELEDQAGASQGKIDRLRLKIEEERKQLRSADDNTRAIAERFKSIMIDLGYPGVSNEDSVTLDTRNWKPTVTHLEQEWGFWDTGSGGKKTLFNVCYALAVHEVARERQMPVPNILIIDSPTKNISDDENPELVKSLYSEIYRIASKTNGADTQFLLIDSDLVEPNIELQGFISKRMAGRPDSPSLISYYIGP